MAAKTIIKIKYLSIFIYKQKNYEQRNEKTNG